LENYLLSLLKAGVQLEFYEIEKLNKDKLNEYINSLIESKYSSNDIYYEIFVILPEDTKIKLIFYFGLNNFENRIKDWFKSWQEMERRNVRINQILTD